MDCMRWRYGELNPVNAMVEKATSVEIGDLLWLDNREAKPASEVHKFLSNDLQSLVKRYFLGVAMERKRPGDRKAIRVATTGVFAFPLQTPDDLELGQYLAVAQADGTLLNQCLAITGSRLSAIGRVAKRSEEVVGDVLVSIQSSIMCGGV